MANGALLAAPASSPQELALVDARGGVCCGDKMSGVLPLARGGLGARSSTTSALQSFGATSGKMSGGGCPRPRPDARMGYSLPGGKIPDLLHIA